VYLRVYCQYCRNIAIPEQRAGSTVYSYSCSACGEPLVDLRIDYKRPRREKLSDRVHPRTPYIVDADGQPDHETVY